MSSDFYSQATELAERVDQVQIFVFLVMAFCFISVNAVLIFFMLRYRRRSEDQEVSTIHGNHMLEIVWTIIPTIVCFIIFYVGIVVWADLRTPPDDAMEINVIGQKWSWAYEYSDGRIEAQDLYVPQGKPVKLIMRSKDVIHSFFIPEFRVKEDVVPSYYTHLWFQAKHAGVYNIFCTEYCGANHSYMLGKVHVLEPDAWDRWVRNEPDPDAVPLSPAQRGEQLFTKNACAGCHSIDGSKNIGPSVQGLMGRQERMSDGQEITVDENYISESIKRPNAKLVEGYPANQMPAFEGLLSDEDIADIIAYIKTLE